MTELIKRIMPVILIIITGYFIKKRNILNDSGLQTLKILIINIFLPASLFFAFLDADLSLRYIIIIPAVFLFCILLYLIGFLFKRISLLDSLYSAEFLTGYEFGMVGIALFSGIFGPEALPVIAVIGLGHEIFIWFVFLPLLQSHSGEHRKSFSGTLKSFMRSPIIISILAAVILNTAGLSAIIRDNFLSGGVLLAVSRFSSVTMSLVLLVLGASLRFENYSVGRSIRFLIIRFLITAAAAAALFLGLRRIIPELPVLFSYAWFTFFLLPPPYIIPIYVPEEHKDENFFLSNTIMLYTMFSLIVFVAVLLIFPPNI